MTPAQIVKILVAIAILLALLQLLKKYRKGRRGWGVAPYNLGRRENFDDTDDEDDTDAEDDDMEEDTDAEDDDDMEEDDAEDEDMEDEEAEEDEAEDEDAEEGIEGFANAPAPMGPTGGFNVATDLLPKTTGGAKQNFGEFAPKSLLGQNFLDAKKYIGVDTQGSSLRNANYQLRSDPPNPRFDVGPWSGSTIDPDLMRRPLE